MCKLKLIHIHVFHTVTVRDDSFTWIRQFFNCCAPDSQTNEEGASKQTNQNPSEAIVSSDSGGIGKSATVTNCQCIPFFLYSHFGTTEPIMIICQFPIGEHVFVECWATYIHTYIHL